MGRRRPSRTGGTIVWKPIGPTSRTVVNRAQRFMGVQGLGHAGTLDPLASGILLVVGGEVRKFQDVLMRQSKEYVARVFLGLRSASEDAEGPLFCDAARPEFPDRATVESAISAFVGGYDQVPPRYSAIRIDGERAHARARRGDDSDAITARRVEISEIELLDWRPESFVIRVACGSGTYIRSLVRDIGDRIGTGACLTKLVRTRLGPWGRDDAVRLDALHRRHFQRLEPLVRGLPSVAVPAGDADRMLHGQAVALPTGVEAPEGETRVAWSRGRVIGLVARRGAELHARRMLDPDKLAPVADD